MDPQLISERTTVGTLYRQAARYGARTLVRRPVDAVSYTMPVSVRGRPRSSRIHSSTTLSSSVAAGDVRQVIALTFSAAAAISPRSAGPLLVLPK